MKNQDLIFSNRPKLSIPDRLIYGSRDVAFAPYGEHWRQVRSICVLQLLSNKRVQSKKRRRLWAAFGKKYSDHGKGKEFKMILKEFVLLLGTNSLGDYIPWLGWINWVNGLDARVEKNAKMFDEFLETVLQEHKDAEKRDEDGELDFVNIMLQFQRQNKGSSPVDDDTIKAVLLSLWLDMFGAGTYTAVTILEWAIAELIKNPRTIKILQNEVRKVAGRKKEINEDDLEKMPYLKAVMKESLRLHTPTPLLIPHESIQDTKVMGYDITAGTRVLINAWAIGRDPSLWENPEEFRPERFLDSSIDYRGLHFELVPFGAGRRGCPGISFGLAVDELALAKLVHNSTLHYLMEKKRRIWT
ncbi:hypothetical protein DH2020_035477 [Rehmannia glutinosa]|uniref:Uncharacterized protein n=1 Tax=Rehmannia glutinosa TaxID=99300 RepID=A0ABR0V9A5_REHGL